jgi:AhpD family alkylhydroperoxidase
VAARRCNLQAKWLVRVRAIVDWPLPVKTEKEVNGFESSPWDELVRLNLVTNPKEIKQMYSISNLTKLKSLDEDASEAMQAFWSFDKAAFAPGAIDVLNKQLIAVAVALTTQCPYCIELHVKSARKEGATNAMLAETAVIAAAMRAGGAITHATHLFKD